MSPLSLVLVAGFPGSGKTETATILARHTRWALLDKDPVTRPLAEGLMRRVSGDPHDRQSAPYLEQVRPLEYRCLMLAAWSNLACGTSVVACAPFLREVTDTCWMDAVRHLGAGLGARVHVVWVTCDPETMRERLHARGARRDGWKLTHWREYLDGLDLGLCPTSEHHLVDNGCRPPEPLAGQVARIAAVLTATATTGTRARGRPAAGT